MVSTELHSRTPALGGWDAEVGKGLVLHFLVVPLLTRDRGHRAQTSAGSARRASTGQIPPERGDTAESARI